MDSLHEFFFRGVKDRIECNACAGMVEYFSFNFIYFEWEQILKWAKIIF
jgi:hypothetical protein